ncbi:MAG: hypothetical protein NTW96_25350 [Planctomycetia bacterium]|nr:hypothetical protein [Planctomycetia bacterium]
MNKCMNRQQYDDYQEANLAPLFADDDGVVRDERMDELFRCLARQYPKTIDEAIRELRFRGFFATPRRLMLFGPQDLRTINGAVVWYKQDIDEAAENFSPRMRYDGGRNDG